MPSTTQVLIVRKGRSGQSLSEGVWGSQQQAPLPKDTLASTGHLWVESQVVSFVPGKIPLGLDVRCAMWPGASSGLYAGIRPETGAWGQVVPCVGISVGTGDSLWLCTRHRCYWAQGKWGEQDSPEYWGSATRVWRAAEISPWSPGLLLSPDHDSVVG